MTALAAIVLAAGASSRMGRPKADLLLEGRTLLEHAVEQARAADARPIIVVWGAHPISTPPEVLVVEHPQWQQGPSSSLQAGLAQLERRGAEVDGLLICTIDRPLVQRETMLALRAAFDRDPDRVWQPRHGGRRGHPLVWPRQALERLRRLPATASRRALLEGPGALRRAFVDVADPAILHNIDRPADLARLVGSVDAD